MLLCVCTLVGCAKTSRVCQPISIETKTNVNIRKDLQPIEQSSSVSQQKTLQSLSNVTASIDHVETSLMLAQFVASMIDVETQIEDVENAIEDATIYEETASIDEVYVETASPRLYEPSQFQILGVLNWNGWRWTYYSQRVLPGSGLSIPGRHVDDDGYVCDENDCICLASSILAKGTVVETPLGKQGCVYDCGCAEDVLDVYVDW